jgi:hypothetical protein
LVCTEVIHPAPPETGSTQVACRRLAPSIGTSM